MIEKFIFFPKNGPPQIVIISGTWTLDETVELVGSANEKDIEEGRFQFYPKRRCQPYSPELWNACMKWISKRDLLKAEYEQLMKKGVDHGTKI